MTANELADALEEWVSPRTVEQAATMLRQQQAEIEELKERLEETRQLYIKQLALQRLSDIGQEIEDRDSAIHATGYWKGIEYKKLRELTDQEIYKLWVIHCNDDISVFARAILKKASEK
jgi:hypothetical protein